MVYRQHITWANGQVPTANKVMAEAVLPLESEPVAGECLHFVECCRKRIPRTDGHEGLRVLRVLQAAQHSLDAEGEAISPMAPFEPQPTKTWSATGSLLTVAQGARSGYAPSTAEYFVHPSAVVDDQGSCNRQGQQDLALLSHNEGRKDWRAVHIRAERERRRRHDHW